MAYTEIIPRRFTKKPTAQDYQISGSGPVTDYRAVPQRPHNAKPDSLLESARKFAKDHISLLNNPPAKRPAILPSPQQFSQRLGDALPPLTRPVPTNQSAPQSITAEDWDALQASPRNATANQRPPVAPVAQGSIVHPPPITQATPNSAYLGGSPARASLLSAAAPHPGGQQPVPPQQAQFITSLIQAAMRGLPGLPAHPAGPPAPQPVQSPVTGSQSLANAHAQVFGTPPGTDANATANRAAAVAGDAHAQQIQAQNTQTHQNRLNTMAATTAGINQDTQGINAQRGLLDTMRTKEGLKLNPANPAVTPEQAKAMGGNVSYESAVPPGYALSPNKQLMRVRQDELPAMDGARLDKANNVLKTAEAVSDAAGKPKYANAKDYQERSSIFKAAMARKIAGEADGTYRTAGQRDDETPEQFAARKADIANAKMSRSVRSEGVIRQGRQDALDQAARAGAPSEKELADADLTRARAEEARRTGQQPKGDPTIDAPYIAKINSLNAQIENFTRIASKEFRPPADMDGDQVKALAAAHQKQVDAANKRIDAATKQLEATNAEWRGHYARTPGPDVPQGGQAATGAKPYQKGVAYKDGDAIIANDGNTYVRRGGQWVAG